MKNLKTTIFKILLFRGFGKNTPFVSFLYPVVSISEPVKLQSDDDADVANLKT